MEWKNKRIYYRKKYNLKIAINFRINKNKKMNITHDVCYFVTINYLFQKSIIKKNRINYKIKK